MRNDKRKKIVQTFNKSTFVKMVSYIAWTAGIRLKKIEYCATVATIHTA